MNLITNTNKKLISPVHVASSGNCWVDEWWEKRNSTWGHEDWKKSLEKALGINEIDVWTWW